MIEGGEQKARAEERGGEAGVREGLRDIGREREAERRGSFVEE